VDELIQSLNRLSKTMTQQNQLLMQLLEQQSQILAAMAEDEEGEAEQARFLNGQPM